MATLAVLPIYEQQIFELQKKILLNLCFCLYSTQEVCLLNYILSCLEAEQQVKSEVMHKKFANADRIIESLKAGKMIKEVEKMDKNDKFLVINQDLFIILESVCKNIEEELGNRKKSFEENNDKVKCKKCGKLREKYKVGFIPCDCQSDQVIQVNTDNSEKLQQISLMQELVNRTLDWRKLLQLKKKELALFKTSLESNPLVNNEVTDMKEVMIRVDKQLEECRKRSQIKKSVWSFQELKNTGFFIRKARKQYKPKREFSRIKQLEAIKKRRKLK